MVWGIHRCNNWKIFKMFTSKSKGAELASYDNERANVQPNDLFEKFSENDERKNCGICFFYAFDEKIPR